MEVIDRATPHGSVRFIVNNEWNVPNLAWGNYVKDPIEIKPGYSNQIRLRLSDQSEPK
jgi:hypothetical protein